MKNFEIPLRSERTARYRFFEILPGLTSWSLLIFLIVLSYFSPELAAIFIIAYLLLWFVKAVVLNIRSIQGFKRLEQHKKLPWRSMLKELTNQKVKQPSKHIPTWHYENIVRLQEHANPMDPYTVKHLIVVAAYNETREVLEPTIQSVLDSDYNMKNVHLILAYEERGGERIHQTAQDLIKQYGKKFAHAAAIMHPDGLPHEVKGKGGNITFATRQYVKDYIVPSKLDPSEIVVTTLDSDNRPHPQYLAALTYLYAVSPDPMRVSFQPIPVYTNNIWDAPAPMRVIATGNTFWNVVLSLRPHMIRNFSSHAQPLQSLIETDYWSVRTIVEDGHQFWRSYFAFDGRYDVYPMYLPIGQDAVLSDSYWNTIKAQFKQLQRWAYGASDIAYVVETGFFKPNKVPKLDLIAKFARLFEGHISWATAPLLITFAALLPNLFNPDSVAAIQLPIIAQRIMTIATLGILVTLFLSLRLLPPKPQRYKRHKSVFMVLQWVLLPATTIIYNGLSALNSQTRLMFGKYLETFVVTDKAVVTKENKRVI